MQNAHLGRRPLQRQEGGLKPPLHGGATTFVFGGNMAGLARDLLGFELAVEGFENPVLEDVALAGFYVAEDEAKARRASVENDGFGFEGFSGLVDSYEDVALLEERGRGFQEAALQADFRDTAGNSRFGRGFGRDFGCGIKRKS